MAVRSRWSLLVFLVMSAGCSARPEPTHWLMVQTGSSGTYSPATQTLEIFNVDPTTLFFSDRPQRVAARLPTPEFIARWATQFGTDPPNAVIVDHAARADRPGAVSGNYGVSETVFIIQSVALTGDTLTMKIKLIKGALPEKFDRNSIFIDHLTSDACTTSPQPFGCVS